MMFEVYTVTFFGHRYVDQIIKIEYALEDVIGKLLREQEYVEFLLGRDGEFDLIVASCIKKCQKRIRDDNSAMTWVLPYGSFESGSKSGFSSSLNSDNRLPSFF